MMKKVNIIKRVIDVAMTIVLLFVMAYQVTGEKYHEWFGTAMILLFVVHNILNIRWYGSLFKGKYNLRRILWTVINLATLAAILVTGYSGMAMSKYVFSELDLSTGALAARSLHLAGSYWSFLFMSCHLGIHWGMMVGAMSRKTGEKKVLWWILRIAAFVIAVFGAVRFYQQDIYSYMFLKNIFAYFDYEKASVLVLMENAAMLGTFVYIFYYLMKGISILGSKKNDDHKRRDGPLHIGVAVLIFLLTFLNVFSVEKDNDFGAGSWESGTDDTVSWSESVLAEEDVINQAENHAEVSDGFLLIKGGTFEMGSPESENWRSADETLRTVTVSDFYMSPYEVTGEEYEQLMGDNPSMFKGENLPVESVTWLQAVAFCNAKSESEGLEPAYIIDGEDVSWNRAANGYRLPTEAEWEYACRAGTTTPFNTETSISPEESNYYGHYPYEIEENYFSQGNLTTQPGEYRQTTVDVASFLPNEWGLYNMHGNVSEWVWDVYGAYESGEINDPVGTAVGNRRVYRGGGWNDFAKNMRSAYRAAMDQNQESFNLGIRLVRNVVSGYTDVIQSEKTTDTTTGNGKVLIAYFSWGGNTRRVAEEISSQIDADLFEITLVEPYSTDYNTVLEQAQNDQHIQARPEIENHVENMDEYDVILLGYPNWWASIPMPIASFLEEYDLAGKTIIPFCSHGGGRFGQSITAITKLEPKATMGEGLAIHYSGGSTLSDDVDAWLHANGLKNTREIR